MSQVDRPVASAADVAFLERCQEDLDAFFAPHDEVAAVVLHPSDDATGEVELEARVVVGGRPATFAARGETIVEAYARLRAAAPEERVALAFRALVGEHAGR